MFAGLTLTTLLIIAFICAIVIVTAGSRMVATTEKLASKTKLGHSIAGAMFMGVATSLSGTVLSVTAAFQGQVDLAVSNALGGIAVQTLFLVVGDILYRRVNIEHAAATLENLMQGVLLIILLCMVYMFYLGPSWTAGHVHPGSLMLVLGYVAGLHIIWKSHENPQWKMVYTYDTERDKAQDQVTTEPLSGLILRFAILAAFLFCAGVILTQSTIAISEKTGLSQSVLGALMTSTITSLPELVTTLTAIKRKALRLAVGNIIGGNTFDVLFLSLSDVAYLEGSIYHTMGSSHFVIIITSILMTGFLVFGLLRRERIGPATIGKESVLIAMTYILYAAILLNVS